MRSDKVANREKSKKRPDESGHYKQMYDYRRMTDEQRKQVVAERRAREFPLHKPPHLDLGAGWYFISTACFEHRHQFKANNELTALTRRLLEGFADAGIPVGGWVVMPNHYHLLVKVDSVKQVGSVVGPVHGRSGRYANQRDNQTGRQVWYKYSDRKVRSERHYWTCLHYIIMNPVKHGFAPAPADWPWSCYHELLAEHGKTWIEDLQREYPLLEFGKGWDD